MVLLCFGLQSVTKQGEIKMNKIFYIGQIFEKEYPPEAAEWCNQRGDCHITELESNEDIRRFQIVENPQLTAEELKARTVEAIKSQLYELDLKSIRALRAGEAEYLEQYEAQAVALRMQLQELERGTNDSNID